MRDPVQEQDISVQSWGDTIHWVTSPPMVFPLLQGDHVKKHIFIRVPPPTTVNTPLCQVKAIPGKPECIELFTMVNTLMCQVRAIPHKPEGIEPFTMVNTLLCYPSLTNKKVWSPSPQSTLHCVKLRPCPHTQSTLSDSLKVMSSVSAQVPNPILTCVTLLRCCSVH